MKRIILALTLCSLTLSMASCARGGNIDRGNGGRIGTHYYRSETAAPDTERDERRYHNGIGEDIYDLPRDIRRGMDDAGNEVHDGLRNAERSLRNGLNRGGSTPDNRGVIK